MQGSVVQCRHRPITENILISGPIEFLIMTSLQYVVCDVWHDLHRGIKATGSCRLDCTWIPSLTEDYGKVKWDVGEMIHES